MKKIIIPIIALSGLLFPGCQDDTSREVTPDLTFQVNASIDTRASRVSDSGFAEGDTISLYTKYTDGTGYQSLPLFVYNDTGWNPKTDCQWKDYSTAASFAAFYPHATGTVDLTAYNFSIRQDQNAAATATTLASYEASDLLISSTPEITSGSPIHLYFHHAMSKLIVNIKFSEDQKGSTISDLKILNTLYDASANILTGEIKPKAPASNPTETPVVPTLIPLLLSTTPTPDYDVSYTAILLPGQTFDPKEAFVSLKIASTPGAEENASIKLPELLTLQSGEQRTITLRISGPQIFVEVSDIQHWTELPRQSGIAGQTGLGIRSSDDLANLVSAWNNNPADQETILAKYGTKESGTGTWTFNLLSDIDLNEKTWKGIKDFNGVFDGRGFTISNLKGTEGLFLTNSGTIRNLKLDNVTLNTTTAIAALAHTNSGNIKNCFLNGTTNITTTAECGALVCTNTGNISNCHVNGKGLIKGTSCGGIVATSTGGSLKDCSSALDVSGTRPGGIAGESSNTTFDYCYATGNITGTEIAGGLIATHDDGDITNSYATGDITGAKTAGGLVGEHKADNLILNCYAIGKVEGTKIIGGLIGIATGKVINSYTVSEITLSGTSADAIAGGLIGSGKDITIKNCYSGTTIMSTITPGGLAGKLEGTNDVDYSYWNSAIPNTVASGTINGLNCSAKSIEDMQKPEFVTLLNTQKDILKSTYPGICPWHTGIGNGNLAFALLHFGK